MPFIYASADDKNGNSLPDGGDGFGWPRFVLLHLISKCTLKEKCCKHTQSMLLWIGEDNGGNWNETL